MKHLVKGSVVCSHAEVKHCWHVAEENQRSCPQQNPFAEIARSVFFDHRDIQHCECHISNQLDPKLVEDANVIAFVSSQSCVCHVVFFVGFPQH